MLPSTQESIASLMAAFRAGDSEAGARLIELFYPELKQMAARQMRAERADHSWQPTLLVNELFLQVVKIKTLPPPETEYRDDRAAFFALSGQIMKRLLIQQARPLMHKSRKVPLWEETLVEPERSLREVEEILSRLAAIKPVIRTIVELKVFAGHTAEEIAQQLGCATVTVHRHWQFARRWMRTELAE